MWAEQSPTRSDPEGSSRNEFASGHAGLSPVTFPRAAGEAGKPGRDDRRALRGHGAEAGDSMAKATTATGDSALPYRVLARKYRPVDFTTLIGQEAMVRTLRNAIATGRIAHAFMLTGVRGVGKTTTARILARAFNYEAPGYDRPSVEMPVLGVHCQAIIESRHVDVIEMDAASHTGIDLSLIHI